MPAIEELQNERPEEPVFYEAGFGSFIKTTSVCYSEFSEDVHHELEIIVQNKSGIYRT
jgi:2-keto-4-pentenoate hydratase/2-oxohepta-3-ene-1,7-dioic acid hydratase in catechol pathway